MMTRVLRDLTPLGLACCALLAGCAAPGSRSAPRGEPGVEAVLDSLHRAAAEADGEMYFSLFAPEAIFLGTDATERWTIEEFRAFALPYFDRESAWTYVPRDRHISPLPGGDVVFFDELLDHEKYGECRGSGVLRKIDGSWRIAQYNLSFPIPNDVAGSITRWIRHREVGTRWVFIVRHAEKESEEKDPPLSTIGRARAERLARILADVPLAACIGTGYLRTQQTVDPAAKGAGIETETVAPHDFSALLTRLDALPGGSAALVAGHSNTVPEILKRLGIAEPGTIADDSYGELFAVRRGGDGTELLRLRY